MSDEQNSGEMNVQVHVPSELEYHYRDIANVYVGAGDVVIEFGNFHRSAPGKASIQNRVVLSISNAYQLQESLAAALAQAQNRMRQELDQQK